jgi:hypothetical protein
MASWHSASVHALVAFPTLVGRYAALLVLSVAAAASWPAVAQTLAALGPLDANGHVTYFIAPPIDTHNRPGDDELAVWALESWQRATGGALTFVRATSEADALVRLYWAAAAGGQYGEMRPLDVDGRRGAAVYIRPDTGALGDEIARRAGLDALFRDTIVYLTCLHELGHALGLRHTDEFTDVMYFFGFGGDIGEFFGRYRRDLRQRSDIRASSGWSAADRAQLEALYELAPPHGEPAGAN